VVGNSNVVQCEPASRGSPELCVSSSSIVIGASSASAGVTANHGRYFATGSSRRSSPRSRSCMIAVAVNNLLCEAMRNLVCGVIATLLAVSAKPKPFDQTSSWSATTPMAMPGRCRESICPSSHTVNKRCAACTSGSPATSRGGACARMGWLAIARDNAINSPTEENHRRSRVWDIVVPP
jgi:hypothetical protein